MTTGGVFKDVVDATIRGLWNVAEFDQANELYYQNLGLTDYEPDVPEEVLSDLSGPTKAILGGEGQEYGVSTKINGLNSWIAHLKSLLIGLKPLSI